jgi:hypothetical protein
MLRVESNLSFLPQIVSVLFPGAGARKSMPIPRVAVIRWVIVVLLCLGLLGLWIDIHLPTYRYELTVEVDTPNGVRSGTTVLEVRTRKALKLLPDMTSHDVRLIGEAVVVHMPDGQNLYATLRNERGNDLTDLAETVLISPSMRNLPLGERLSLLSQPGREAIVPRAEYPLLARFRIRNDPRSIESIDPDNLVAAFGPGVHLRRIFLRTTTSAPTFTMADPEGWLDVGWVVYVRPKQREPYSFSFSARDLRRP